MENFNLYKKKISFIINLILKLDESGIIRVYLFANGKSFGN